jgi:hypothetical protein
MIVWLCRCARGSKRSRELTPSQQSFQYRASADVSLPQPQRLITTAHHVSFQCYLKRQNDFTSVFPKSRAPRKPTVCRLSVRFSVTKVGVTENILGALHSQMKWVREPSPILRFKLHENTEGDIFSRPQYLAEVSKMQHRHYKLVHIVFKLCTRLRTLIKKIEFITTSGVSVSYKRVWCCFESLKSLGGGTPSDDPWFRLGSYVNNENSRIWTTENARSLHEKPL